MRFGLLEDIEEREGESRLQESQSNESVILNLTKKPNERSVMQNFMQNNKGYRILKLSCKDREERFKYHTQKVWKQHKFLSIEIYSYSLLIIQAIDTKSIAFCS